MLNRLQEWLKSLAPTEFPPEGGHSTHELSAALLIQLALVDDGEDPREIEVISDHLSRATGERFSSDEIAKLVSDSRQRANDSTSLYEFTSRLNEQCSEEQKREILRDLWRVAYADGRLDKFEEHFIRRAADLLYIPHGTFISLKHDIASSGN